MTADSVYSLANWILLGVLIFGVLATYALVVSGNIKEKEFKKELSEANQKVAELNERAAAFEKEAEQARLEAEQIKLKISWREITAAQRRKIISALKGHPLSMDVVCIGNDPEACEYAQQLITVLEDSGSNPKFVKYELASNNPSGLLLGGTSGPDMELLQTAFRAAGIHFSAGRNTPKLELRVGTKPRVQ